MIANRFVCLLLALIVAVTGCRKKPAATTRPLHRAAESGDLKQIESQLSKGDDVDGKDKNGWTPLHWASQKSHTDAAKLLISNGADVNAKGNGWTPLFLALPTGNVDLLEELLTNGADANAKCGERPETPLYYTLERGHNAMAQALLAHGANPDTSCGLFDETPLHIAVGTRNVDAVKMLIANGADLTVRKYYGRTPLHVAATNWLEIAEHGSFGGLGEPPRETDLDSGEPDKSTVIADLLVSAGAAIDTRDNQGQTPLHEAVSIFTRDKIRTDMAQWLIAHGADVNARDRDGSTPLHVAVSAGHLNMVELLVAGSADVNAKTMHVTPFVKALRDDRVDIAEFLLSSGADIDGPPEERDKLLVLAASSGFEMLARRLIAGGIDVNSPAAGWMALRCALWQTEWTYTGSMWHDPNQGDPFALGLTDVWRQADTGHRDVAELLIAQGANVNVTNGEGRTALHETVRFGDQAFAMSLLAHGADVNAKDSGNETPLHCAAWDGKTEFAAMLLGHGAHVDAGSSTGTTPLNCAARGHKDLVELLLANGASVNTKDKGGNTPLHTAALRGHTDIVKLLVVTGADVSAKDNIGRTPTDEAARRGHRQIVELLGMHGAEQ